MANFKMICGGVDKIESLEYVTFTVNANTPMNIPTSKKAKAIVFNYDTTWELYAADGVNNNRLYSNGSDNGQTITFGDNAITSDVQLSSSTRSCKGCIIY